MKHTLLCAVAIVAACASTRPPSGVGERIDPVTVDLRTKAQFFGAPDAAPVVPPPGRYRVEVAGPKTLRLVPADGKEPVDLSAVEGAHEEKIEVPVACTFQSDEDTEQVVLRLPGGKALLGVRIYYET